MPGTFPIAEMQSTASSRTTAKVSALKFATLQFLQPGVLPVLALAIIVGGWSYGLKLSHYLHHTDVTKASTTRMWLDHRNDSTVSPVVQLQVQQKFLVPVLCVFTVPPLPHFSRQQLLHQPAPGLISDFVSPLHSLRAPPISLSLA